MDDTTSQKSKPSITPKINDPIVIPTEIKKPTATSTPITINPTPTIENFKRSKPRVIITSDHN